MAGDAMVTGKIIFKAFTFFMLQPFGITLELLVVHLWYQFSGDQDKSSPVDAHDVGHLKTRTKSRGDVNKDSQSNGGGKSTERIPPLWIRCVGFGWLVIWMAWTAPYIIDPLCIVDVFSNPYVDLRRFTKD
jgi:hypothetical protein